MKTLTVRFDDTVYSEVKELSSLFNCSMNEVVVNSIREMYSKVGEDPEVKKALNQLQQMKELLDKFNEENK